MRRETVYGKTQHAGQVEISRFIADHGEMLARASTSGLHLADEMKARILNTFLTLMNLRENLDRAALRQPIGRTGGERPPPLNALLGNMVPPSSSRIQNFHVL